jgi:PEP-CTERM motif-containing protein
MFVGSDGPLDAVAPKRGLIEFDIPGHVPAGATISSAALSLFLGRVNFSDHTPQTILLFDVTTNWAGGTNGTTGHPVFDRTGQGFAPNIGDATWNFSKYKTIPWNTPGGGGDFVHTESAGTVVSQNLNTAYVWGSTAQMVSDVQGWLDGTLTNFGWLLKNDSEGSPTTVRAFYTREGAMEQDKPGFAPALTVSFEPPVRCNPPECVNFFSPLPLTQATSLTEVLAGNVVGNIDVAATQNNPLVNPFAYVNQNFFGGAGTSSINVSLDSNGNTDITYTGSNPILSTYQFKYGPLFNGEPHSGFEGTLGSGPLNIVSQYWSNLGTSTALPAWTASCPTVVGPIVRFVVLYGEVSVRQVGVGTALSDEVSVGSQPGGEWLECAEGSGPLTWTITNPTEFDEILDNFGFLESPFEIDLTKLNFNGVPPPDQFGSPFFPLSGLDGLILAGGASVSVTVEPEPASLAILGVALVGFGFARHRKVGQKSCNTRPESSGCAAHDAAPRAGTGLPNYPGWFGSSRG